MCGTHPCMQGPPCIQGPACVQGPCSALHLDPLPAGTVLPAASGQCMQVRSYLSHKGLGFRGYSHGSQPQAEPRQAGARLYSACASILTCCPPAAHTN